MPLHVQGQQQDYLISRVDHTQLFKRNIFDITPGFHRVYVVCRRERIAAV